MSDNKAMDTPQIRRPERMLKKSARVKESEGFYANESDAGGNFRKKMRADDSEDREFPEISVRAKKLREHCTYRLSELSVSRKPGVEYQERMLQSTLQSIQYLLKEFAMDTQKIRESERVLKKSARVKESEGFYANESNAGGNFRKKMRADDSEDRMFSEISVRAKKLRRTAISNLNTIREYCMYRLCELSAIRNKGVELQEQERMLTSTVQSMQDLLKEFVMDTQKNPRSERLLKTPAEVKESEGLPTQGISNLKIARELCIKRLMELKRSKKAGLESEKRGLQGVLVYIQGLLNGYDAKTSDDETSEYGSDREQHSQQLESPASIKEKPNSDITFDDDEGDNDSVAKEDHICNEKECECKCECHLSIKEESNSDVLSSSSSDDDDNDDDNADDDDNEKECEYPLCIKEKPNSDIRSDNGQHDSSAVKEEDSVNQTPKGQGDNSTKSLVNNDPIYTSHQEYDNRNAPARSIDTGAKEIKPVRRRKVEQHVMHTTGKIINTETINATQNRSANEPAMKTTANVINTGATNTTQNRSANEKGIKTTANVINTGTTNATQNRSANETVIKPTGNIINSGTTSTTQNQSANKIASSLTEDPLKVFYKTKSLGTLFISAVTHFKLLGDTLTEIGRSLVEQEAMFVAQNEANVDSPNTGSNYEEG